MTSQRLRSLPVLPLLGLVFCAAGIQARPAEAADGYYSGLKLPFTAGEARVVVRVTEHGYGRHAVDFGISYEDVLAMYPGVVAWTRSADPGYGNYVVVDHLDNYCAIYAHFDKLGVRAGQPVAQGERLGRSGNTGQSTGPHLHAAVFRKINGACGPANGATEVQMIFAEGPQGELRGGDWVVSRNVRTERALDTSASVTSSPSLSGKVTAPTLPLGALAASADMSDGYAGQGASPGMRAAAANVPPPPFANIGAAAHDGAYAVSHVLAYPDPADAATDDVPANSGDMPANAEDPTFAIWDGVAGWVQQVESQVW